MSALLSINLQNLKFRIPLGRNFAGLLNEIHHLINSNPVRYPCCPDNVLFDHDAAEIIRTE